MVRCGDAGRSTLTSPAGEGSASPAPDGYGV